MAERKKRGLGRGLGALIPDAASNDRPVDVFFSGGDSEDTRDSSSSETKRPRAARTDPAASMQSSRRRKAKSGTNTTGSSVKTASESSVENKRAAAPNSSSNKTAAAGAGELSASKTAKATPARRTAKAAANNSTEENTSGSRAATGTASKAAAGGKKSTAAKSTAAKTSGTKTSGTKTSGTKTSGIGTSGAQATAGKTDSRSAGSKASSSNTETNSDAEAPRADSTSPDAKAASTSKPGAEHSDAHSADGSESLAAAVEASETKPKAQAPETDSDSDSADENAADRQNGSDGVYETHPGVYTSGSDDPDSEESEEQYVDPDTTEVVDTVDSSVSQADEGDHGLEGVDSIPDTEFGEIDVERIEANPRQPRTVFDEDMLAELVHSIREIGVLQPVVVRQKPNEAGRYELIMGERRLRATKDAGLATIPAIIRYVDDTDLLRDALLENLHRAELNPLEEAAAYGQLLEDFGCTQEELSERIGRSRPQISNTLRLLRLPPLVQRRVAAGVISAGHARAILGLREPEHMEILAQRIVAEGLSVRASEEAVVLLNRGDSVNVSRGTSRVSPEFMEVAERLGDRLDTKVNITVGKRKGKLSVEFANQEDLDRILTLLGVTEAAE